MKPKTKQQEFITIQDVNAAEANKTTPRQEMKKRLEPKKVLKKHFKANLNPTKFNLLTAFEQEYRQALEQEQKLADGKQDGDLTQAVLDKYMNMETDLFDSDDLNDIIDKIEN